MKHQNMKVLFEGWRRFINENEKKTLIVDDIDDIAEIAEIAQLVVNTINAELANRKKASVDGGFDYDLFIEKVKQLRGQALTTIARICKDRYADVNLCQQKFDQRLKDELLKIKLPE